MIASRGFNSLSIQHKLLALGIGPLLLALPLLAAILVVWGDSALDALLTIKIRSDLALARGTFERVEAEVGASTLAVAQSLALHDAIGRNDTAALQQLLSRSRQQHALEFLNLWPGPPPAATERQAADGSEGLAQLALLEPREFEAIAPELRSRASVPLVPEPDAAPGERQREERALVMLAHAPVRALNGRLLGHLQGGVLLNRNLALVDQINRIVYPPGALPLGSQGTATLFLDDVRITTTVRSFGGESHERAIGTRASQPVREAVLGRGDTWLDRAFVVDEGYMSAYLPLNDGAGRRVGMLNVGFLDSPFRRVRHDVLLGMGGVMLALMAAAAWLALHWARIREDGGAIPAEAAEPAEVAQPPASPTAPDPETATDSLNEPGGRAAES